MGYPAKGYKLTASRITILRALAIHGPFEDPRGQAVKHLQAHTGHRRTQSLSSALESLEAVGLVRRDTRNQRTYRIEAVLAPLTPSDLAALELPPAANEADSNGLSVYLTRPRVEVLRALLAGGPIEDSSGHATRILMDRLGRTEFGSTHALLVSMARHGLIRRTVRGGRVVGLAATTDALSTADRRRIWSKIDFPVEPVPLAIDATAGRVVPGEVEVLRSELEASRAEVARLRIQIEVFRAWANRMPTFDTTPKRHPAEFEIATRTDRTEPVAKRLVRDDSRRDDDGLPASVAARPACQFVYSPSDLDRPGQSCDRRAWEGSTQWCWSHDPTPVLRRKAFPVRSLAKNP